MSKGLLIYADPPWPEAKTKGSPRHGADWHFPVMKYREIAALPVKEILGDEPALLALWTTGRHIIEAGAQIMPAWGFRYVTMLFVWEKIHPKSGTPATTLGQYTHPSTEVVMLGMRKGYPALLPAVQGVKQEIRSTRPGGLARKPEEARSRLELMYPSLRKLELFGRGDAPGWAVLGNEIDGLDMADALRRYQEEPSAYERASDPTIDLDWSQFT